ncbi:hypothetical protein [Actinotalea solisilvae]|nr:hypothetical protein [Actinotalea solisilvae]
MLSTLVCRLLGHRPTKVPRDDEGGGFVYACRRCCAEGVRPPAPRTPRR